jgi:peptidoglycan/LPS O-acetylase OafA/YrhL
VIEDHYFGGFLLWPFGNVAFSYGIIFFFTLSGFLITTLLLRDQDDAAQLRIFPIYYATLLLGLVLTIPEREDRFTFSFTGAVVCGPLRSVRDFDLAARGRRRSHSIAGLGVVAVV